MRQKLIELAEKPYLKAEENLSNIKVGDLVSVHLSIIEVQTGKQGGTKERIQKMEGVVISQAGTGISSTVTVRKISNGVGVEKVFLLHSPSVKKIEILKTNAKLRKAKMFHWRNLRGKKSRIERKEEI